MNTANKGSLRENLNVSAFLLKIIFLYAIWWSAFHFLISSNGLLLLWVNSYISTASYIMFFLGYEHELWRGSSNDILSIISNTVGVKLSLEETKDLWMLVGVLAAALLSWPTKISIRLLAFSLSLLFYFLVSVLIVCIYFIIEWNWPLFSENTVHITLAVAAMGLLTFWFAYFKITKNVG